MTNEEIMLLNEIIGEILKMERRAEIEASNHVKARISKKYFSSYAYENTIEDTVIISVEEGYNLACNNLKQKLTKLISDNKNKF